MRLSVEARQDRILRLVREKGRLRLADLAAALGVSAVTVRRDVEALTAAGRLRRLHGAVLWPEAAGPLLGAGRSEASTATAGHGVAPVIGMVVPNASYYYADVIKGARAAAAAAGARLVLGITNYRPEEDGVQAGRLLDAGVDGLLFTPSWDSGVAGEGEEDRVLRLGVPTVLVERRTAPGTEGAELDRVCSDHTHGAFLAVRHLVALGHRQIVLATRPHGPTGRDVKAGYEAARRALALPEPLIAPFTLDVQGQDVSGLPQTLARLRKALDLGVRAVVIQNDLDAIGVVQALRTEGVRIPDDLAVIAYDDEMAALADIPLTAVAPPKHSVGEEAVRLLLHRFADRGLDPAPRRHVDLLPELRVRASCGGADADR